MCKVLRDVHLNYVADVNCRFIVLQDYPSISQLISVVKEKSINLIFAVTENTFGVYNELSKLIHGSTAGVLANDSSNIVDLVQENYDVSCFVKPYLQRAELNILYLNHACVQTCHISK